MEQYLKSQNALDIVVELSAIHQVINQMYFNDREQREMLKKIGAQGEHLDTFEENRNILLSILDALNIWIENSVLLNINDAEETNVTNDLNFELILNLFLYGTISRALSLIALSDKFSQNRFYRGFYGLEVNPYTNNPIEPLANHPVIYTNTLVAGNQNALSPDEEYKEINNSIIGHAFKETYGIEFLHFVSLIHHIHKRYSDTPCLKLSIHDFGAFIKSMINVPVSEKDIRVGFSLTPDRMSSSLKSNEKLIWKVGVNKYRFELCPFIMLNENDIIICPSAAQRSFHLWNSLALNGGMPYTDIKDKLYQGADKKNLELSNRLIELVKNKFTERYPNHFCDTDVVYDRIWDAKQYPKQQYDFGDYDVIFYDKDGRELYLIEAKFISDALHPSRMVSDYEKIFTDGGYYEHCKKRYELLFSNPQPMKDFIGAVCSDIKVHTLFVSSKALDLEFQDEDKLVTFLSLENLEKYLDGKLLDELDETIIIRPTNKI